MERRDVHLHADARSDWETLMRVFAKDTLMRWFALLLSTLLAFEPVALAQSEVPAMPPPPADAPIQGQPAFSQQELDQMLAPIALYPDPLLSHDRRLRGDRLSGALWCI